MLTKSGEITVEFSFISFGQDKCAMRHELYHHHIICLFIFCHVATFQPKPKRETMSVTSVRYSVDYCLVAVLFYSEPLMSFGCRQVAPENWRVDFVVGVSGEWIGPRIDALMTAGSRSVSCPLTAVFGALRVGEPAPYPLFFMRQVDGLCIVASIGRQATRRRLFLFKALGHATVPAFDFRPY